MCAPGIDTIAAVVARMIADEPPAWRDRLAARVFDSLEASVQACATDFSAPRR